MNTHERFMRECFRLARKGRGHVSPNPLVGSVLTVDGQIVARGYHKKFGGPHAEVFCLKNFRGDISRATLYVNLEPCSYYGKTPPCTDLLLQRGIKRLVVASTDPNPRIAGKGCTTLRRAGVRVELGVLEQEAQELNRFFFEHVKSGMPFVHLKIAQSLDGFIASKNSRLRYLTSPASRKLVHRWRAEYDAVLVGARTIAIDDPRLDVRYVHGRDPAVVVLDGRFRVSEKSRIFKMASNRRVFLCTTTAAATKYAHKKRRLEKSNVVILEFASRSPRMKLNRVLKELYRHRIGSILVEGGADVFSEFIQQNLVNELSIFTSPLRLRSGVRAMNEAAMMITGKYLTRPQFRKRKIGRDQLISGMVK